MTKEDKTLLATAIAFRQTLQCIQDLLFGYSGINGNKSYVLYCLKKSVEANEYDFILGQMNEDTFNADMSKRKEIDVEKLNLIARKLFKLLDDIDTAGDIFKPKWCKITAAVEQMHRVRWLNARLGGKSGDGLMALNENCHSGWDDKIIIIRE